MAKRRTSNTDSSRPLSATRSVNAASELNYPPDIKELWAHFQGMRGDWLNRIRSDQPIYALPEVVISSLMRSSPSHGRARRIVPLISEQDAAAERHLSTICRCHTSATVGVWDGKPIIHPLLIDHWSALRMDESTCDLLTRQELLNHDQLDAARGQRSAALQQSDHQMLGYMGYLATNSSFQKEIQELKETWTDVKSKTINVVSTGERMPGCTLGPIAGHLLSNGRMKSSARFKLYQEKLQALCRKWYLRELVTWDLPVPWPPFSVTSVFDVWLLVDRRAPVFFHAPYSAMPTNVQLRNQMNNWQRKRATPSFADARNEQEIEVGPEILPLKRLAGRNGSPSEFETTFRMWFVELAVRQRYGNERGLVNRLLEAFEAIHKLSGDRLKRLRKAYVNQLQSH